MGTSRCFVPAGRARERRQRRRFRKRAAIVKDQRISLTRILAVNWCGFRQILDVANHTLVAGVFKSGKSALLDLIQYVMLGEHWRPNRAAAGSGRGRSLVSYCLCDTNTTRDGESHYIRRNGVT